MKYTREKVELCLSKLNSDNMKSHFNTYEKLTIKYLFKELLLKENVLAIDFIIYLFWVYSTNSKEASSYRTSLHFREFNILLFRKCLLKSLHNKTSVVSFMERIPSPPTILTDFNCISNIKPNVQNILFVNIVQCIAARILFIRFVRKPWNAFFY